MSAGFVQSTAVLPKVTMTVFDVPSVILVIFRGRVASKNAPSPTNPWTGVTVSPGLVTPGTANTAGIGLAATTALLAGLSHGSSSLNCLYRASCSMCGRIATRHDSSGLPVLSTNPADAGNPPVLSRVMCIARATCFRLFTTASRSPPTAG